MTTPARTRFIALAIMIFTIALFRLLPHPPNVSPVAAIALFGGAYFCDRRLAFLVPFAALFISDLLIGLHNTMLFVYAGFALTVAIGFWISRHRSVTRITGAAVASTLLFFLLTNAGAWLSHGMYPRTMEGLMQAYAAGIPFLQNSMLGNLFFTGVLFGGYHLLQRTIPSMVDKSA